MNNPDTLTDQFSLFLDVLDSGSFSAAARRHPLERHDRSSGDHENIRS